MRGFLFASRELTKTTAKKPIFWKITIPRYQLPICFAMGPFEVYAIKPFNRKISRALVPQSGPIVNKDWSPRMRGK